MSVAVTLGLLVAGLAYGTYATSTQLVSRWEQQIQAENELHLFTRRFSRAVRSARGVRRETADGLALHHEGGDETTYKWDGETLLRDGTPVQLQNAKLASGTFVVHQAAGRAYVVFSFSARLPGMTGAPVRRSVRVGITVRFPMAWRSLPQSPDGTD